MRISDWSSDVCSSDLLLTAWGQIDTVINILYVVLLGSVGGIMAREALGALRNMRAGLPAPARKRRHHPMVANLPLRWRFYRSGLYISPLAPLILGIIVGILRSEEHTSELQSLMRISYAVFCLKHKT